MSTSIDIVIPIFNEEETLPELFRRLEGVFVSLPNHSFRVICVNDGSRDASLSLLVSQHRRDSRYQIIDLSRNFGHQAAITAGLAYSDADATIILDADLQDPPELFVQLIEAWKRGAQVVLAERASRKETGLRRLGFEFFYRVAGLLVETSLRANTGVFGLMDKQVVSELKLLPEKNRFIPGLRTWMGFSQETINYNRQERAAGAPKQSFPRLVKYGLDAIFSFSYKPLRVFTAIGVLVSLLGFALALFFLSRRVLGIETAETGFTTLVTLILLFGGLQFVFIGVVGEYVARIYDEVKRRPQFIVRKEYGIEPRGPTKPKGIVPQ